MSGNVFRFDVDTTPMGESLLAISGDVRSATGTIVRSTELIVAAEEEGAREVSENITSGFYTLIRSQLDQKRATSRSGIDAKSAQLVGEKKAGEAMEAQFIGDFNRIKNRYARLFGSLNKTLKMRAAELDKEVFQLVEREYKQAIRKRLYTIGSTLLSSAEGARANSVLRIGQAKGQVLRFLESIKNYLAKTQQLNRQISSILRAESIESVLEISVPFLVAETDASLDGQRSWMLRVPKGADGEEFFRSIDDVVGSLDTGKTVWEEPAEETRKRVAQHFFALLETTDLSERMRSQMKSLYEASTWMTMKDVAG